MECFHATRSGRTSLARSPRTKEPISPLSLPRSRASSTRARLICLSLRVDGRTRDVSWVRDSHWHGEYLTHNISVWPNDAAVSILSQILQADPHPRFYLSPRACQGILNRAARKNKTMPTPLKQALEAVAAR
ncbi:Uncharacterised protein [Chlamydia trachomatis]|nr:Uncharacterised protein [Chlamydia trachomatis]